jgi:BASS family bile acid:Na+ symporter
MTTLLLRTSNFLASHSSLYVILAAIVAFLLPETFSWVKGDVSSIILGIIMLTMGLTLSIDDFRELFRRPLDILIGACAQYTLMPMIAWGLSVIFDLNPYLSIGIILVGCCPGGVSSNIMSYLCRGDVAYTVGMTTASTLLAPLMTPLLVWWLADTRIEVDVTGMFRGILLITLIPVGIGFLANTMMGKKQIFKNIQSFMPGVSVTCLALIVGGVVAQVRPQLVNSGIELFLLMLCVVFLHNTLGYATGYSIGALFGFSTAKKRTISIEVGMQNAGMATVLATSFFASSETLSDTPEAILCVIPCAMSCAYHSISGTILANLFIKLERK